eukprot:scaffold1638_cov120-Cylindrotheca_fusiformis.AAC.5
MVHTAGLYVFEVKMYLKKKSTSDDPSRRIWRINMLIAQTINSRTPGFHLSSCRNKATREPVMTFQVVRHIVDQWIS